MTRANRSKFKVTLSAKPAMRDDVQVIGKIDVDGETHDFGARVVKMSGFVYHDVVRFVSVNSFGRSFALSQRKALAALVEAIRSQVDAPAQVVTGSLPEVALLTGLSVTRLQQLCRQGRVIDAVKDGADWRIPMPPKIVPAKGHRLNIAPMFIASNE